MDSEQVAARLIHYGFDIFEVKIDWKKIFFIENEKFVQKSMVFPIKNRIFALVNLYNTTIIDSLWDLMI